MFEEKGVIIVSNEDGDVDEDKLMELSLESGAEDFEFDGEIVLTDPLGVDTRLYDIIKDRVSDNL